MCLFTQPHLRLVGPLERRQHHAPEVVRKRQPVEHEAVRLRGAGSLVAQGGREEGGGQVEGGRRLGAEDGADD